MIRIAIPCLLFLCLFLPAQDRVLSEKHKLTYEKGRKGRTIYETVSEVRIDRADWSSYGRVYLEDLGGHVAVNVTVTDSKGDVAIWTPTLETVDDSVNTNALGFKPSRAFVIPGLTNDAVLSYRITRTWTKNQPFEKIFYVGNHVATDHWSLSLEINKDMTAWSQTIGKQDTISPRPPTHEWVRKDLPAAYNEPDAPPNRETTERIWLMVKDKDNDPPKIEDGLLYAKRQLAALHTPVTMDIMRRARRLTRGKATEAERIAALYAWVTSDIRDMAVDDMLSAHTGSVLTSGFAHPFQKAALLQSLLEASRIPHQIGFFQANTYGRMQLADLNTARLSPMIVIQRPDLDTLYLAPYLGVADPNLTPESMRYADAVIKEGAKPKLIQIKPKDQGDLLEEEIALNISSDHFEVTHHVRAGALSGNHLKAELSRMTAIEIEDWLGLSRADAFKYEIDTSTDCHLSFSYRLPLNNPANDGHMVLSIRDLIALPTGDTIWIEDVRTQPFRLENAQRYSLKVTALAKDGVVLQVGKPGDGFQNQFGDVIQSVEASQDKVVVQLTITQHELEQGADALADYNAYKTAVAEATPPLLLIGPAVD